MTKDERRLQEEMLLRGFIQTIDEHGPDSEYAAAYDNFLDEHGFGAERIGDKPDHVRNVAKDLMEATSADAREDEDSGTDTERANRILEVQLGNYLAAMDDLDNDDEHERTELAGIVEGLRISLECLESAEDGADVTDLGIGGQSVSEMRSRAQRYREDE
jgi:hypothetical protein